MQRRESKAAMLQQRADPAVPARPVPCVAASGRLEQRAEAAQERRVVCLFVCGCEASTPLCWARCWRGAGVLAVAEASRVKGRTGRALTAPRCAHRQRV